MCSEYLDPYFKKRIISDTQFQDRKPFIETVLNAVKDPF